MAKVWSVDQLCVSLVQGDNKALGLSARDLTISDG